MTVFAYSALTADGRPVSGRQRARTLGDARRAIGAQGLHGIRLDERPRRWDVELTPDRVAPLDRQRLLRQLAVFVRSGVPILDALQVLADEADDRLVRRSVLTVIDDVRSGSSLAEALSTRHDLLAAHHMGVIRAAERTGRLADALDDVVTDLTRELEMRGAIRSALTYPLVVVALAMVTVVVLTTAVLPRFQRLFDDLGADPPLVTRVLLAMSRLPASMPALAWLATVAVVAAASIAVVRPRSAPVRDRVVLRMPGLGGLVRLAALERFCRILATSLQSGVPLPSSVWSAGDAIGNSVLRRRVHVAHDRILAGQGLSRALSDLDVLTPAVGQMIAVGETTGTLALQCDLAAEHLHDDLRRRVARATTLLEPLLIVSVGVVVGFVAVALVGAMYGLIDDLGSELP